MLLNVLFHLFHTSVVLNGDFSVYVSLTETEKCLWKAHNSHKNVVLPVVAILHLFHTNVVLSGDFSVYVSLTEMENCH